MKIEVKALIKIIEYLKQHSDQGKISVTVLPQSRERLLFTFSDLKGTETTISLPEDEREFGSITKTERF